MKKYWYYISYSFYSAIGQTGFEGTTIIRQRPITSDEDVTEVTQTLMQGRKHLSVVIITCYPWAYMTGEELERVGMDSGTLPKPPDKTWEIVYPWLVIRCEGCRRVLAEFDAAPRQEEAIYY